MHSSIYRYLTSLPSAGSGRVEGLRRALRLQDFLSTARKCAPVAFLLAVSDCKLVGGAFSSPDRKEAPVFPLSVKSTRVTSSWERVIMSRFR
jgi:hypothetical protein